jgi:hypothetical protein
MLLGAQPGSCTSGELKATSLGDSDTYRCSCREKIRNCPFWEQVSEAMAKRGYPNFDITAAGTSIFEFEGTLVKRLLKPIYHGGVLETVRDVGLRFAPGWRSQSLECARRNVALIASLQEVTGASVVVDSSKNALRLKYLLRIPELDVRVIRVKRDGRAVALTYIDDWNFADSADPEMRGGGTGERRLLTRRSVEVAANSWKRSNESCDALIATLPRDQWTEVCYEEICADPTAALKRLAGFLDLDPAGVTLDFRAQPQHVIGNGMRMDTTSEIRLDERWKENLTTEELSIFDRVAGDLNRSYGYQ